MLFGSGLLLTLTESGAVSEHIMVVPPDTISYPFIKWALVCPSQGMLGSPNQLFRITQTFCSKKNYYLKTSSITSLVSFEVQEKTLCNYIFILIPICSNKCVVAYNGSKAAANNFIIFQLQR